MSQPARKKAITPRSCQIELGHPKVNGSVARRERNARASGQISEKLVNVGERSIIVASPETEFDRFRSKENSMRKARTALVASLFVLAVILFASVTSLSQSESQNREKFVISARAGGVMPSPVRPQCVLVEIRSGSRQSRKIEW